MRADTRREPVGYAAVETRMLLLLARLALGATVAEAFPPPEGAVRVEAGDFGAWLADLPLAPPERPVRTHDGRVVSHRARVVLLPMVPGDLQQCADSAIRLRAEWLREQGEEVVFHATSGDPLPWARWQAGDHPHEVGGRIAWRSGAPGSWEGYLARVFQWAGSASLHRHDTVAASDPRPGDLLVEGGFPGHVVVLLDVARRGEDLLVLVGEGFMPAQDFHVELGPEEGWWRWEDGVALAHWPMPASALRRWPPSGDERR